MKNDFVAYLIAIFFVCLGIGGCAGLPVALLIISVILAIREK